MQEVKPLKHIKSRVIVSGNVVEITTYENGYYRNYQSSNIIGRSSKFVSAENKLLNREKTMKRAKSNVRRIVCANPQLNKFFTLTFAENVTDLKRKLKTS